jgi:hypothetical protein
VGVSARRTRAAAVAANGRDRPWFFAIANESGALCTDDLDEDGRIIGTPGRYQQVQCLWPGEDGYLLFALDLEYSRLVRWIWEYADSSNVFRHGRLIASYRDLGEPDDDFEVPF